MTFTKNLKILWNDVSFNRSVKMLGVVMIADVALFVVLWLLGVGINAEVYQGKTGRHAMSFIEYAFCVLGAIGGDPEMLPVYVVYAAIVRLAGAIFIDGWLTAFSWGIFQIPTDRQRTMSIAGTTALSDSRSCRRRTSRKTKVPLSAGYSLLQ